MEIIEGLIGLFRSAVVAFFGVYQPGSRARIGTLTESCPRRTRRSSVVSSKRDGTSSFSETSTRTIHSTARISMGRCRSENVAHRART